MHISEPRWLEVLTFCGVRAVNAARWAPLFEQHVQPAAFSQGLREIDDFVGQILHESHRLERLAEDLNYSAQRLMQVWPSRFRTLEDAKRVAWSPERLAERVYGGRMGNRQMGDAYKYKGRGLVMVTGRDNYALLQGLTGEPLVDFPVLLESPEIALRCALLWWEKRVPDGAIDTIERVTKAVNGGAVGLADRMALTFKAGESLA